MEKIDNENKNVTKNVVIIGGGPAGLSAAIYNARAGLNPIVIAGSPPGGQLTLTSEVENFPGYESILGADLIAKIREQAKKLGATLIDENVLKVDFSQKPFKVQTASQTILAKAVLIATGAKALWLGLESEKKLRGKGVSACATCDGFFFRNKRVAVVGGGDTALEEALTLTKFASKVYLIHRRDSFRASKIMQERVLKSSKIEVIWNSAVEEILGENKVTGIKLLTSNSPRTIELDGVFIAIGHKPDTEIFSNQIELDAKGYIATVHNKALQAYKSKDQNSKSKVLGTELLYPSQTTVPGVFAAGDCVDHIYRQAATAAGMGVAAALDVEKYLVD